MVLDIWKTLIELRAVIVFDFFCSFRNRWYDSELICIVEFAFFKIVGFNPVSFAGGSTNEKLKKLAIQQQIIDNPWPCQFFEIKSMIFFLNKQ